MTTLNDFTLTDNVDDVLAAQYNLLLGSILRGEISNSTTMTGTVTLADVDVAIQRLNCNGDNRIVQMPPVAAANHPYLIVNATGAAFTLDVRSNAGVAMLNLPLKNGESVFLIPDGSTGYKTIPSSNHQHLSYDYIGLFTSVLDDFELGLNAAAGMSWAGAPFVIPTLAYGGYLKASFGTTPNRAFLYRGLTGGNALAARVAIVTNNAGHYHGLRYDDGTDNNYIEFALRYNAGNSFDVIKNVRTGGGAITTTSLITPGTLPLWYVLTLQPIGTQWTSWAGQGVFYINSPGGFIFSGIGAALAWTPTRVGLIFQSGNASWQVSFVDWYDHR